MRARPNSAALEKRKRFSGRPNFAHARALCESGSAHGAHVFKHQNARLARWVLAEPLNEKKLFQTIDVNQQICYNKYV